MCPPMEANDDKAGPLLISRPDGAQCWRAWRCADRSKLRSILPSSPEGGALICFPSGSHHVRVFLKEHTMHLMTTLKLQCKKKKNTASHKKSKVCLVSETQWSRRGAHRWGSRCKTVIYSDTCFWVPVRCPSFFVVTQAPGAKPGTASLTTMWK